MAFTTPIHVAILFPQADGGYPQVSEQYTLRLLGTRPPGGFTLVVHSLLSALKPEHPPLYEGALSPEDSRRILELIDQLPGESQSIEIPLSSLDGREYRLLVMRPGYRAQFTWMNEDWRRAPGAPQETWEHIAALVEIVFACSHAAR